MKRTHKFTDRSVKALISDGGQVDYYDRTPPIAGQSGQLGIRVSQRSKAWFVQYRVNGRRKRLTFTKRYPELSLKDARVEAADHLRTVYSGGDPNQNAKDYREAPTVKDLWKAYQDALENRAKSKAVSTIREENRRWEKIIEPAIGHMKVEDITPAQLSDMLDRLAKKAPVSANRLHSLLQVMFKPALAKGWITVHPLQWIDKPGGAEPPRKRVLSDDEIRTLWPHLDDLRPNPRDILKLGLLTAQRPGEIMSMKWEDVDMVEGVWIIRDTKAGNDHHVPLSKQVTAILECHQQYQEVQAERRAKRYKIPVESYPWVFQSEYNRSRGAENGHARSTKQARKKLHSDTGVVGWSAHDLRRSARTVMSRLKIKPHIRELVLNHSQGGIVNGYDQYDYLLEKRKALQKLADEIDRIIGKEMPEGKVVEIRRTG